MSITIIAIYNWRDDYKFDDFSKDCAWCANTHLFTILFQNFVPNNLGGLDWCLGESGATADHRLTRKSSVAEGIGRSQFRAPVSLSLSLSLSLIHLYLTHIIYMSGPRVCIIEGGTTTMFTILNGRCPACPGPPSVKPRTLIITLIITIKQSIYTPDHLTSLSLYVYIGSHTCVSDACTCPSALIRLTCATLGSASFLNSGAGTEYQVFIYPLLIN